jgi:hypothetical protein
LPLESKIEAVDEFKNWQTPLGGGFGNDINTSVIKIISCRASNVSVRAMVFEGTVFRISVYRDRCSNRSDCQLKPEPVDDLSDDRKAQLIKIPVFGTVEVTSEEYDRFLKFEKSLSTPVARELWSSGCHFYGAKLEYACAVELRSSERSFALDFFVEAMESSFYSSKKQLFLTNQVIIGLEGESKARKRFSEELRAKIAEVSQKRAKAVEDQKKRDLILNSPE